MKRIPTPDERFHDGNPATGELGTIVQADWLNHLQEEVAGVIEGQQIALDGAKQNQLAEAIAKMVAARQREYGIGHTEHASTTDANTLNKTGIYGTETGTVNIPVAGVGSTILHQQWNVNAASQIFTAFSHNAVYFRRKSGGVWQPWVGLWHEDNLTPAAIGAETPSGAQAKVDAAINALLSGAPGALDTLNELAAALNDDADFAASINNALSARALADWITTVGLASDDPDVPYMRQASTGANIALVPAARTVTSGDGLTGGGSLGANRVITLGLPGGLNASSTNNVSGNSHTHSVDAVSIVNRGLAGVGSYAFLRLAVAEDRTVGDLVNGAYLNYASAAGDAAGTPGAGTWRLMGDLDSSSVVNRTSLWQRVA